MLGSGVGLELRNPLGIVMVGGLLLSQVLTLFTTPVIYSAFDRLRGAGGRHEAGKGEGGRGKGKTDRGFIFLGNGKADGFPLPAERGSG